MTNFELFKNSLTIEKATTLVKSAGCKSCPVHARHLCQGIKLLKMDIDRLTQLRLSEAAISRNADKTCVNNLKCFFESEAR